MNDVHTSLESAMRHRWLIRCSRRFESTAIRGYVLGVGPEFFLLALVSDRIWLDGFECFRVKDVSNVRRDPYADFVETALRLRNEQLTEVPPIDLANIKQLLLTANNAFPLITIHREDNDPGVCHIGYVVDIGGRNVSLHEICPDATWEDTPANYALHQITRVNFGGDYENALHLVGGNFNAR